MGPSLDLEHFAALAAHERLAEDVRVGEHSVVFAARAGFLRHNTRDLRGTLARERDPHVSRFSGRSTVIGTLLVPGGAALGPAVAGLARAVRGGPDGRRFVFWR